MNAVFTEIDGKPALVFDEMPMLVFVSHNGNGSYDQVFEDGVKSLAHRGITISSKMKETTSYTLDKVAVRFASVANYKRNMQEDK